MPNKWTFEIAPISCLLAEEMTETEARPAGCWIDPFAGRFSAATVTNDIDSRMPTHHHQDALEFLREQPSSAFDGALFDPPYSPTQASRSYKAVGMQASKFQTSSGYRAACLGEIRRVLKPGGKLICFGWNSNGAGKSRGFCMTRVLLVAHGAGHNDTIVTVERKME